MALSWARTWWRCHWQRRDGVVIGNGVMALSLATAWWRCHWHLYGGTRRREDETRTNPFSKRKFHPRFSLLEFNSFKFIVSKFLYIDKALLVVSENILKNSLHWKIKKNIFIQHENEVTRETMPWISSRKSLDLFPARSRHILYFLVQTISIL